MKKLFAMAAIAVMCLTGCNKANTAEEALDFEKATPEAVVSALAEKVQAGDATAITAALETVQTQLAGLIDAGNVEKVTEYAAKIKAFVEENAEALKNFNIDVTPLTAVIDKVAAMPGAAQEAAEDAAQDAAEAAQAQAEAAADAAIDEAESKVDEAVKAAEKAVDEAIETGKAKTNEAIQGAADKIKL